MEKFAGLNFHGFNPTEVFAEILSRFLFSLVLITEQSALLVCSGFILSYKLYNYNKDCSSVLKVSVSVTSIRCTDSLFQSLIVLEK